MDFERIVKEAVAGLLNPLRERRDYGGNELDKRKRCECGRNEECECGRKTGSKWVYENHTVRPDGTPATDKFVCDACYEARYREQVEAGWPSELLMSESDGSVPCADCGKRGAHRIS